MSSSIFDLPLGLWEYEAVDEFLKTRPAENDRLEYKQAFTDNLTDTLVAFCNSDGGHIFIGVSEVPNRKIPKNWPLLDQGKDYAGTVYNKAAAETTPNVRPQATVLREAASGRELVVIRVEPGPNPPYFARNRGVKIRVGDSDVHADPGNLELLFARRVDLSTLRGRFRDRLQSRIRAAGEDPPTLRILLAPLRSVSSVRLGEATSDTMRRIVRELLPPLDPAEDRSESGMRFGDGSGEALWLYASGELAYDRALQRPGRDPAARGPIQAMVLFQVVRDLLKAVRAVYAEVVDYSGPLYLGVCVEGIYDRELAWPTVEPGTPYRRRTPEPFTFWVHDDITFMAQDDALATTRAVLKSLAWRMGYSGHEAYFDRWGSGLNERE